MFAIYLTSQTIRIAPIFCVSNVTGSNLDLLRKFLNLLPARTDWEQLQEKPSEFHIDATWSVPGVGTVVSGKPTKFLKSS